MRAIPRGWKEVTLGDIALVIRGITFPAGAKALLKSDANVCCLRTSNIQSEIDWSDIYFVPREYVKREDQLIKPGDVLMSMANSYELVGKVAIVRSMPHESAFGAFLSAIRPTSLAVSGYLFHMLRTAAVQLALREGSSQTTNIANISASKLISIPVPLAPEKEQQRIADKLDTVLARVDSCRDRLARAAPLIQRLRNSILEAAASGRLTADWRRRNVLPSVPLSPEVCLTSRTLIDEGWDLKVPSTWRVVRALNAVKPTSAIVYGIVQPGPKLATGIPYVQCSDIADGQLSLSNLSRTSPDIARQYERSTLQPGDVLLGIIRATKVAVVPHDLIGANISRSVARLRPSEHFLPGFLSISLSSPTVQRWLRAQHRGIDMPVLNLSEVRLAPIPIAPISEQAEVVRRVETLFAFADRLEARLATALSAIDRLTPALLAKAFRGELVPQDPADEPATELLKRLHAQTAQDPQRAAPKRGRPAQKASA